ncbi:MAG: hypothetical protein J6Z38_01725, partial [Lachnospiraceae bacterium]|nr:hypothetical protein [Lachnospiraceae bacterium]
TKETDALIQGILSGRGQRAVQRAGYVPVIDVGSTDPEDPEISDERSLSLSDTYTLNPVRVTTASDVYHSYRYNYEVLSGLDDASVQ